MASFRLVSPGGQTRPLTCQRDVHITNTHVVHLKIQDNVYTLRNDGADLLSVKQSGESFVLSEGEERELTQECDFYIEDDEEATHYRVVLARSKRQKNEKQNTSFGFHLYRLRSRETAESYESDLKKWFDGDVEFACLSNYMINLNWLISVVPSLKTIPNVLIIHGEMQDDRLKRVINAHGLKQCRLHRPPLPIPFGTHHSKACILKFPTGIRIVIHTANLIYRDCGNKTQGAWIQDFPPKSDSSSSEFEEDLVHYVSCLGLTNARKKELTNLIQSHDFSSARVKLIASVPGYHKDEKMEKYGHLLLRQCLSKERFQNAFNGSSIVGQFSSLGAIDEKWLYDEFLTSLGGGKSEDGTTDLQLPSKTAEGLQLVWPTIQQVKHSIEGWVAGQSIPGVAKNVTKPFLKSHWRKFDGRHIHREHAMPHIKTYTRYSGNHLAWVLLASHNLSKAAWGVTQKKGTQFMIRSYELGVLFLPSLERRFAQSPFRYFSCTEPSNASTSVSEKVEFLSYPAEPCSDESMTVSFCLPYKLPPDLYTVEDDPWVVDVPMPGLDVLGNSW